MKVKLLPAHLGFTFASACEPDIAMLEANASEFNDVRRLVSSALKSIIHGGVDRWVDLVALYSAEAIVDLKGKYFSYPYSIDQDNRVVLGNPREVVRTYTPVGVTSVTECVASEKSIDVITKDAEVASLLLESLDSKRGLKWRVIVIGSGLSGNNNFYPDTTLLEAAPMFEGTRVFNKSDEEHIKQKGKSFNNLIGKLSNPTFIKGTNKDTGRIEADLTLLESAGVHSKMLEAFDNNMHNLFGFSIDANAQVKRYKSGKVTIQEAKKLTQVKSLDLIIEPGAGGTIVNLIEAKGANTMLLAKMLEAIKKRRPAVHAALDHEDQDAVETAYAELLEAVEDEHKPVITKTKVEDEQSETVTQAQMQEALATQSAKHFAATALTMSKLPKAAVEQLQTQFDNAQTLTTQSVTEAIDDMQKLVGSISKSGHVKMDNVMHGNVDDGKAVLEALLDPENKDVTSIREAYLGCTGDTKFTGMYRNCSKTRLVEALDSSSFPDALGDAITRRMIEMYQNPTEYDYWQPFVDVVPVNDFRTQERIHVGGYGDLADVGEGGAYPALTSPSDGKETYSISKKGGTESVTLEMIANDDMSIITRIPTKMTRSAKRTLSKFVFNMFVNNPDLDDGNAWFHASRSNLGTAALSAAAYSAGRIAMMRQQEPGSNAELGLAPKFLLVPPELEETAFDLFRRDTNHDETFAQSLKPTIVPVWCWSDANDWVQTCDRADHPIIELGFFQGREEPEVFIQDSPTVGSMFTNDKTTYKIRHIYGGAPMSGQGVRKNAVA